ncbi:hypothetical protein [Streptomyces sp. NPDC002573]|uniref:hypothetical protein n=1 Tax=Streptomyces sp. NPDC002573 TaxID=3364651 RepID=UPI003684E383
MRTATAVTVLVLVLGSASAVVQARKGQWWRAGSTLLPVLGMAVMLFGGVERRITSLFWLGCLLVLAGFGAEAVAYWRTRTPGSRQAGR